MFRSSPAHGRSPVAWPETTNAKGGESMRRRLTQFSHGAG